MPSVNDRQGAEGAPERRGVRFDATINLGHVLTFVGFVVCGFGAWNLMEKRVVVLEERAVYQDRRDAAQDAAAKEVKTEIREALQDVRSALEKLRESLDRRAGR